MACWIVKFYLLKNEDIGRTFGSRQLAGPADVFHWFQFIRKRSIDYRLYV